MDEAVHGAANIAEKAAEFRAEAEACLASAARGRRVERSLAVAARMYEVVYELEHGTRDVVEVMTEGFAAARGF